MALHLLYWYIQGSSYRKTGENLFGRANRDQAIGKLGRDSLVGGSNRDQARKTGER